MSSLLQAGVRRLLGHATPTEPKPRRADVIAICAQKGGVGKTTTAVNVAAALARFHDKSVLLIDMDGQGHCAVSLANVLPTAQAGASLSDILLGKRRDVSEIARPTKLTGLWVCPSDKGLGHAEGIMAGRIGKEFLLRTALKRARTQFDVIVIDCPPNLGSLTVNALMAAEWLLVPCDMSVLSVEGVDDIFETVETIADAMGHPLSVLGVLRTRYDARNTKINASVERTLQRYTRHVLPQRVPVNTHLAQAQLAGQPIFDFDGRSRGADAYAAVAQEIVQRIA